MVFIECQSCLKTVEIDGEEAGVFECPYCENDIDYEGLPEGGPWVLIGIFFFIFFAALLMLFINYLEDSDWEETEGEILSFDYSMEWDVGYRYTFMVDGESFNGSDGCSTDGGSSNCGGYDVGDSVKISYNPENPNENEMVDNQPQLFFICCFALPSIVLGLPIYRKIRYG